MGAHTITGSVFGAFDGVKSDIPPNPGVEATTRVGTYWARRAYKQKFLFCLSSGAQINFSLQFSIGSCTDMTLCLVLLHWENGTLSIKMLVRM